MVYLLGLNITSVGLKEFLIRQHHIDRVPVMGMQGDGIRVIVTVKNKKLGQRAQDEDFAHTCACSMQALFQALPYSLSWVPSVSIV